MWMQYSNTKSSYNCFSVSNFVQTNAGYFYLNMKCLAHLFLFLTMICSPQTIIVQPKRFVSDGNGFSQKKNDPITLSKHLDISSVCSPGAIRPKSNYILSSVIKHHGNTMAGGHFSTYSVRQSNELGDRWTHSNDQLCTPTSLQDVLSETDGYIVTYSLQDNNEATTVTVTEASLSNDAPLDEEESSTDMQVALSDSTPYTSSIVDSDTDESVHEVINLAGKSCNADKDIKKQQNSRHSSFSSRSSSSSRSYSSSRLKKKDYSKKKEQVVDLTDDDEVIVINNATSRQAGGNQRGQNRHGRHDESRKRRRSNSTRTSRTKEATEIINLVKQTEAKKSKSMSNAKSNGKADDDDDEVWILFK